MKWGMRQWCLFVGSLLVAGAVGYGGGAVSLRYEAAQRAAVSEAPELR